MRLRGARAAASHLRSLTPVRVLFVSNHFPPSHVGGYEIYCAATASALRKRGHEVLVVTSGDGPPDDPAVCRELAFDMTLTNTDAARHNGRCITEQRDRFLPDVAIVWNTYGLHHDAVFSALESLPTTCYLMLHDLAFFGPSSLRDLPLIAASQVVRFHFLRRGFKGNLLRLVYPGVPASPAVRRHTPGKNVQILFCGRIISYKGLHVALLAMELLPDQFTLTVIGEPDANLDYGAQLRHWVTDHGLDSRVMFRGGLPHAGVLEEYAKHDILVFPSLWEEPLGLVVLEAMAAGLPVVASRRGAPVELITSGRTGLFHEPGNQADLARVLQELSSPPRRQEIGHAAREEIELRFGFARYVSDLESIAASLAGERRHD